MKNEKNFRLSSKKIFLTYSQIDKNIKHQDILECLTKKLVIGEYLVALESHQDGGLHAHVLLLLKKRCDIRNVNFLDLEYNGFAFHGNYQSAKQIKALISYIIKEDMNYITNMGFLVHENRLIEPEEHALHESKRIGIDQALKNYKDKYPDRAVNKLTALRNTIKTSQDIDNKVNKTLDDLTLEDFDLNKLDRSEEFKEWLNSTIKRTLLISGKTGTGKSLLAKAIMKELKINFLRATNYEGLKNLEDNHQGFILDDAKLSHLDEPSLINLVDTKDRNDLRLLHQVKSKKEGLVQIFTINEVKDIVRNLIPAISRRMLVLDVQQPIINITINNNYYLNFSDVDKGNREAWKRLTGEDPEEQ